MTTSESINELATALAKAQGQIGGATKGSTNPFYKSKYADLASVRDACQAPLSENGLSVVQSPNTDYVGDPTPYEFTSRSGEARYGVRVVCVVSIVTRLMHTSGQWLEDRVSTILPTGDPQAVGSAITYLRRYALQSFAGVAPEDDDAEGAHGRGTNGKAMAHPPQPPADFHDWMANLEVTARNGTAALQAAWACSPTELRQFLVGTNKSTWESLKDIAAKAVPKIPAGPRPVTKKDDVTA